MINRVTILIVNKSKQNTGKKMNVKKLGVCNAIKIPNIFLEQNCHKNFLLNNQSI